MSDAAPVFPRPFPMERVVYVNGTGANAARRPASAPAPTIHFGERLNSVHWEIEEST